MRWMLPKRSIVACGALGAVLVGGCFAPTKKIDGRTALEQQVIAAALYRAVEALPIEDAGLEGTYRVEILSPKDVDENVVRSILYRRLFEAGVDLTENPDVKVPKLLAHVVYAGSDLEYSLLGMPVVVPGLPIVFGSISLYSAENQRGRARVRLSIWDDEERLLGQIPGTADGTAYFKNETFLTFIGPFIGTDMEDFLSPGEEREPPEETEEEEAEASGGEEGSTPEDSAEASPSGLVPGEES